MEEKIVDIFDISYEGSGVGKIEGKVVFVPKTLIGEKVEVEIEKDSSTFSVGKVTAVLQKSGDRIEPACPHFSVCSGCAFQHCSAETERKLKTQILARELAKIGFNGEIKFVESDKRFGYRNKLKLEYCDGKLGYYKGKSRDFFEVETCPIADQEIVENFEKVREFLRHNQFKMLKNVYFKRVKNQLAIVFLFDKNEEKHLKNVKKLEILSKFSVFFAYGDVLESNNTQIFYITGDRKLKTNFGKFETKIEVSAFNQVNDFIADKLYGYVCEKTAGKRIINAYSGQGKLSFMIAQNAKIVYGIEYQHKAHNAAEELAQKMPELRVDNICGKVEDCIGQILLKDKIGAIVLDPAREGCKKSVMEAILDSKINEIVYISCNFASLVRDLRVLGEAYKIEEMTIFNMFPCCNSMESVAILKRT